MPALIDAVVQNVRFVLVILDNRTTAMTGNQPTPAVGIGAAGESLETVDLETLIRGCGVQFCRQGDPYNQPEFIALLKEAVKYSREHGPAVVISRHPCLIDKLQQDTFKRHYIRAEVSDDCDGCRYCIDHFECPALVYNETAENVSIDPLMCSGCGVCLYVCPKKSIKEIE